MGDVEAHPRAGHSRRSVIRAQQTLWTGYDECSPGNRGAALPDHSAMYLVLMKKGPFGITLALLIVIAIILKRTWWNKLEN